MAITIKLKGDDVRHQMRRNFTLAINRMRKATVAAANEIAANIKREGDADIRAAGRFGPRWTGDFLVTVRPKVGGLFGAVISIEHRNAIAAFFETGGVIRGHPYLWLPFSGNGITVPPSQYPGRLFSAKSRDGLPLLFSYETREPIYFGVTSVNVQRKFHITDIIRKNARLLPVVYARHFKG